MGLRLQREEVVWAYRILLGREPESEQVIDEHRSAWPDRAALIAGMRQSQEYRRAHNLTRNWVVTPVFGERRLMWVNLLDDYVSHGCLVDEWEPLETEVVRELLSPGDTFVDIGANIGWFTLLASTIVGESGRIHAFEPRPDSSAYLRKSIALNGLERMVDLHQAGVWSEPGHLTLWNRGEDNPGGTHLLPVGQDAPGGIDVPIMTIDSLALPACDVIKIDVEGAEPHAIRGARDTISKYRPTIVSEINPNQLRAVSGVTPAEYLELMASLGYDTFFLEEHREGRPVDVQSDRLNDPLTAVLFRPRSK